MNTPSGMSKAKAWFPSDDELLSFPFPLNSFRKYGCDAIFALESDDRGQEGGIRLNPLAVPKMCDLKPEQGLPTDEWQQR